MVYLKNKLTLCIALSCLANWGFAQSVSSDSASLHVPVDSLMPVVRDTIVADTLLVIPNDSLPSEQLADSLQADLPSVVKIDSTALILEQVKAVTDMISAKSIIDAQMVKKVFSDTAIVNKYNRLLDKLVMDYELAVQSIDGEDSIHFSPLYFRLFAPLTLYKTPMSDALKLYCMEEISSEDSLRIANMISGRDVRLLDELNRTLLATYLSLPTEVLMTEEELMASQSVSEEAIKSTTDNAKLNVPTVLVNPLSDVKQADINTDMVVQKPNFWKTLGNFSTQMTESFFSPNWYQGGTNNINMLSTMRLEANYNNKKKIQWDNKLEARIGFYQNTGDEIQSNQDMLRMTSKLNLKAIRNWNYTIEAQGETQMMQHFNGDNTLKSRFMTPFNGSLTVGMDFKKNFKNGSISIFPGPLSYKMTYVAVKDLAPKYGVEEGRIRNDIGSKLEVNFNYKITKNISYRTRFYYYTGRYEYVQMDWENTFNFQVSKYISTTLFFHTRFDDHVARNEDWGFLQFKEYLTFGLNYSW